MYIYIYIIRTRYIALNTFLLILYIRITNFFLTFLFTRDTLIRTKEIKFGGWCCKNGFGSRKNSIRLKGIDTVEAKHSRHFGRRKETIISLSLKRSVDGSVLKRKLDRIEDLERHRANPAQPRNVIVQLSSIGHVDKRNLGDNQSMIFPFLLFRLFTVVFCNIQAQFIIYIYIYHVRSNVTISVRKQELI